MKRKSERENGRENNNNNNSSEPNTSSTTTTGVCFPLTHLSLSHHFFFGFYSDFDHSPNNTCKASLCSFILPTLIISQLQYLSQSISSCIQIFIYLYMFCICEGFLWVVLFFLYLPFFLL